MQKMWKRTQKFIRIIVANVWVVCVRFCHAHTPIQKHKNQLAKLTYTTCYQLADFNAETLIEKQKK